jgi:signal transduction histidine kinase
LGHAFLRTNNYSKKCNKQITPSGKTPKGWVGNIIKKMKTDFPFRIPTVSIPGFFAKLIPLYLLLTFFLSLTCKATVVILGEQTPVIRIDKQIDFYEDKASVLTIGDITSGKAADLFKTTNPEKLLYVNSNSSFWFKFNTLNLEKDQLPSILDLPYHQYDSVWLYKVNPDHTYTYELLGDLVPYNSRSFKSNSFSFQLRSTPGQTAEYYVKIRCREVVKFHFTFYDHNAFYQHSLVSALIVGGVLMIFLAMFLYNLFIMIFTGNKGYAYYLVMVASVFGYALVINGVGFHYLWPNQPWFQHVGEYVFSFVANPALILFTKSFLNTRGAYPKTNKRLNILLGIWILLPLMIVSLNFSPGILGLVIGSMTMVNAIVILTLVIIAVSQKYEPAVFFLAGTFLSLVALIIYNLMFLGYIELGFTSFYLPQLLIVTDTVLLSIALSENIRRMREEITRSHIEKRNYLVEINTMKENANIELQKQVKERTLELEVVNEELEAFSYSVSHDLKAPLRGIMGFAQLLQRKLGASIGSQENETIGKIVTAANKMNSMIGDLLLLSQVTKGELKKTSFNPIELTEPITQELTRGKRNVPQIVTAPMSDIYGDRNLMQYVFNNLISNAIKYSSKTEHPVVEVGSMKSGDQTVFYVKDNGAGFDMKYVDKLFQPFHRLHSSSEFEGSGIGLSIVKRIVDRHGGKVWAEAEPDKGATFFFTVPE